MLLIIVTNYIFFKNGFQIYGDTLEVINIMFTTVFTLEAIVKIVGLRWHYFRRTWNVFDFIVVVLSIVGKKIIKL